MYRYSDSSYKHWLTVIKLNRFSSDDFLQNYGTNKKHCTNSPHLFKNMYKTLGTTLGKIFGQKSLEHTRRETFHTLHKSK